jgi:hypothetical protein
MNKFWTDKTERRDFYRFLGVYATVATFVTFALVSWNQSCQTREALKYADTSNQFTRRNIELAEQNYIEENRPYVFTGIPTMDTTKYGNILAHVPIINYGKTPAYKVNVCIAFRCGDTITNPKYFPYDSIWTWMTLAPSSIETMIFLRDGKHWRNNWEKDSTARPYVSGIIWYNDDWSNKLHYTTFAYKWMYSYGDRFTRQYQYESVDRYEKDKTNK